MRRVIPMTTNTARAAKARATTHPAAREYAVEMSEIVAGLPYRDPLGVRI
jgi:hypothetical protein